MSLDIMQCCVEKPQPVDFVLPGLVAGTVGALISPGGSGKSALALQLCAQVSGGPDLLDIPVKPGLSAYLAGEDPALILHHRLFALLEHSSSVQRIDMADNLMIEPLEQHDINIMRDDWYQYLLRVAEGRRLVVLDTLRMIHDADENDSGAMKQVVGRMRTIASTTGCAIVFLHHTNKTSAFSGAGAEQQASRGSSVLVDNVRWQGYMRTMSTAEAEGFGVDEAVRRYFVEFGVSKQNYGAPIAPSWLRKTSCTEAGVEGYTLKPAVLERAKSVSKGVRSRDEA